jgi:hypothetical protein
LRASGFPTWKTFPPRITKASSPMMIHFSSHLRTAGSFSQPPIPTGYVMGEETAPAATSSLRAFSGLPSQLNSPWASGLARPRKNSPCFEELTSGAEARVHFRRLNGTNKFVPFPTRQARSTGKPTQHPFPIPPLPCGPVLGIIMRLWPIAARDCFAPV